MKFEWEKHPESEIYGVWVLKDAKGKRLLDYALWDTCVADMYQGEKKRQSIINGLMDIVSPFISKELQEKQSKLKSKEIFEAFEAKITELTDIHFEKLAAKPEPKPQSKLLVVPEGEAVQFKPKEEVSLDKRKHNHYFKPCPYDFVDVYRVLKMFDVTDPCLQHAIKKLLVAGGRGVKDISKDVQEAIDTLQRKLEMDKE
jgi:hypothetical protein